MDQHDVHKSELKGPTEGRSQNVPVDVSVRAGTSTVTALGLPAIDPIDSALVENAPVHAAPAHATPPHLTAPLHFTDSAAGCAPASAPPNVAPPNVAPPDAASGFKSVSQTQTIPATERTKPIHPQTTESVATTDGSTVSFSTRSKQHQDASDTIRTSLPTEHEKDDVVDTAAPFTSAEPSGKPIIKIKAISEIRKLSPGELAALQKERRERKRQNDLLYARRRRKKEKSLEDSLIAQCNYLRNDNHRISQENFVLERTLKQAQQLAFIVDSQQQQHHQQVSLAALHQNNTATGNFGAATFLPAGPAIPTGPSLQHHQGPLAAAASNAGRLLRMTGSPGPSATNNATNATSLPGDTNAQFFLQEQLLQAHRVQAQMEQQRRVYQTNQDQLGAATLFPGTGNTNDSSFLNDMAVSSPNQPPSSRTQMPPSFLVAPPPHVHLPPNQPLLQHAQQSHHNNGNTDQSSSAIDQHLLQRLQLMQEQHEQHQQQQQQQNQLLVSNAAPTNEQILQWLEQQQQQDQGVPPRNHL